MEVPTAQRKLGPELVGRWSPVGVGGDVEGGGGKLPIKRDCNWTLRGPWGGHATFILVGGG